MRRLMIAFVVLTLGAGGCGRSEPPGSEERTVTIYVSTDRVFSEPVLRLLSARVGKHTAHQLVYEASMAGLDGGLDLRTALLADCRVAEQISAAELDTCLEPRGALGAATAFVDRVVGR